MATTKCILYGRFSPRPDSAESESIDSQLRDLREDAAKRGWEVAGEFDDPDAKGDDEDREGLLQAVEALKRGMILFVWKGDRLARSVFLSEYLYRAVEAKGAKIVCLHGQTDDTDEGVLVRQIIAAFDAYSKKMNAKRTKYAMLSLQKSGRLVGGNPPFGYDAVLTAGMTKRGKQRRRLVPNVIEQMAIARILELHALGNKSVAIKRILEEDGVDCRGSKWSRTTLLKIIRQRGSLLPETTSTPQPVPCP